MTLWPGSLDEYLATISAGASHVSMTEEDVRAWGLDVELVPLSGEVAADAVLAEGDAFHDLLDSMQAVASDTELLVMTDEDLEGMLQEVGIVKDAARKETPQDGEPAAAGG